MIINSVSYGEHSPKNAYFNKNRVKRMYYCDVLVYGEAQLATPNDAQLSNNKINFSAIPHATEYAVFVTTPPDTSLKELGTTAHLYEVNGKLMTVYNAYPYEVRRTILRMH